MNLVQLRLTLHHPTLVASRRKIYGLLCSVMLNIDFRFGSDNHQMRQGELRTIIIYRNIWAVRQLFFALFLQQPEANRSNKSSLIILE